MQKTGSTSTALHKFNRPFSIASSSLTPPPPPPQERSGKTISKLSLGLPRHLNRVDVEP